MAQQSSDKEGGKRGGASGAAGEHQGDAVRSFLVSLATDPSRLGAFIKDPDKELEAAGLPESDRAALKSGNAASIYGLLAGQPGAESPAQPPVIVLIIDAQQGKEGGERHLSLRPMFCWPIIIMGGSGFPVIPPNLPPPPTVIWGAQQAQPGGGFPVIPPMVILAAQHAQAQQGVGFPLQILPPMQITLPVELPPVTVTPPLEITVAAQRAPAGGFPVIPPLQIQPLQIQPLQIQPLQIQPQIHPQIVQPQIHPQMVFPQFHPQIIAQPQIHPQLVVFPQLYPQIYPQMMWAPPRQF